MGTRCRAEGGEILSNGVILWHEDCDAAPACTAFPEMVGIDHWMVGALGQLSTAGKTPKTMWFPLPLLQAARTEAPERKHAAMIALVGPRDAGKSVLSLLGLDYEGYYPDCEIHLKREGFESLLRLDDYIYLSPLQGSGDPSGEWRSHLKTRSLLRRNQPISPDDWPQGTHIHRHNLKAVFFRKEDIRRKTQPMQTSTMKSFRKWTCWPRCWTRIILVIP